MTTSFCLKDFRNIGLKIFRHDIWIHIIEKYFFETDESFSSIIFTCCHIPWIENINSSEYRDLRQIKNSLQERDRYLLNQCQSSGQYHFLGLKKIHSLSTLLYKFNYSWDIKLICYENQNNKLSKQSTSAYQWELICAPSDLLHYHRPGIILNKGRSLVQVLNVFRPFPKHQSKITYFFGFTKCIHFTLNHKNQFPPLNQLNFKDNYKKGQVYYLRNFETKEKMWKLIRYKAISRIQSILKYVIWKNEDEVFLSFYSFIDLKLEQKITTNMKLRAFISLVAQFIELCVIQWIPILIFMILLFGIIVLVLASIRKLIKIIKMHFQEKKLKQNYLKSPKKETSYS